MSVSIRRAALEEAELLNRLQREAFLEDLKRYNDHDTNPANEALDKTRNRIQNLICFTITYEDAIVGGAMVTHKGPGHYRLNRIFISPEYQNRGIGGQVMMLIEESLPDGRLWELDTPILSVRNQHLYEKLGYKKVGEYQVTGSLILFEYRKEK